MVENFDPNTSNSQYTAPASFKKVPILNPTTTQTMSQYAQGMYDSASHSRDVLYYVYTQEYAQSSSNVYKSQMLSISYASSQNHKLLKSDMPTFGGNILRSGTYLSLRSITNSHWRGYIRGRAFENNKWAQVNCYIFYWYVMRKDETNKLTVGKIKEKQFACVFCGKNPSATDCKKLSDIQPRKDIVKEMKFLIA